MKILRKNIPTMLAQDILGVQPMMGVQPMIYNYKLLSVETRDDVKWYRVRVPTSPIIEWICSQDNELWNHEDFGVYEKGKSLTQLGGHKFVLHERLYTIFALRWS